MKLGILQFSSGSLGMGERIIPDGHLRNCASSRDTTWTRVRLWWSATSFQGFSASETFLRPNKSLVLWGYYSQPDDYEPIFQEVGSFFADWEFRCWSIMVNLNIDSILTHTHMTSYDVIRHVHSLIEAGAGLKVRPQHVATLRCVCRSTRSTFKVLKESLPFARMCLQKNSTWLLPTSIHCPESWAGHCVAICHSGLEWYVLGWDSPAMCALGDAWDICQLVSTWPVWDAVLGFPCYKVFNLKGTSAESFLGDSMWIYCFRHRFEHIRALTSQQPHASKAK